MKINANYSIVVLFAEILEISSLANLFSKKEVGRNSVKNFVRKAYTFILKSRLFHKALNSHYVECEKPLTESRNAQEKERTSSSRSSWENWIIALKVRKQMRSESGIRKNSTEHICYRRIFRTFLN